MKRLLLILSLVVLAAGAPGAGIRSATPALERAASNADGAIVFASTRDGNSDLWAVKADGTGLTQLTKEPFDAYNPLPSPDGRHILFEGGEGMTVMDVDGSGRRAIRSCSVSPEAWSWDSRHLVCSDYEAGILVVDTADGNGHAVGRRGVGAELVSGRDDDRVRRRAQAVRDPGGRRDAASARNSQARRLGGSGLVG